MLFDFATLTGAARVALGPDLPPFYTDDEALARRDRASLGGARDPLWRMPLWRPYDKMVEGKIADLNNSPGSRLRRLDHRRAVPAALRGQDESLGAFRHLRLEPGGATHGPEGGEMQAARALFALIGERFGG